MTTVKEIQSKEDSPSLSDAQKFVGGWVECVHLDTGTLIVDEEGKMKNKPVNEVASKMYADKYGDADIIVGDAIFIPNGIQSDWHRETTRRPNGRRASRSLRSRSATNNRGTKPVPK
jgi:hypothetical protein